MKCKEPRVSKAISEKKNKVGGHTPHDFKVYCKPAVMEMLLGINIDTD